MISRTQKFITILLTCVMLVSAFGIAQFSHICSLALEGTEKISCEQESGSVHECCTRTEFKDIAGSIPVDCCKDIVRYFQIKIVTVIYDFLKLDHLNISEVVLFFNTLIPSSDFELFSIINTPEFPPDGNGRQILTFQHSFLI